jgi:hypothetical protein
MTEIVPFPSPATYMRLLSVLVTNTGIVGQLLEGHNSTKSIVVPCVFDAVGLTETVSSLVLAT